MDNRDKAVNRGIACNAMLYDKGRHDSSQLAWLYDLALQAPDGPAIELGVYHGGSVATWAAARVKRGPLYAVDNWSSKCEAIFGATMARCGIEIETITAQSWDAAAMLDDVQFAFCFVDSAHAWWGFPRDMLVWPQKVMPGGILAMHDYGVWKANVVVKAITDAWQMQVKWEPLGRVGSTIAFRNPIPSHDPASLLAHYLRRSPGAQVAMERSQAIHHQFLDYQAAALYDLVSAYNRDDAEILEIGTLAGYSASIMAQAAPAAQLITLNAAQHELATARKALRRYRRVEVRHGVSWDMLAAYEGPHVDVIFVDGDHRHAARDTPWFNWLNTGGLILFHDYTPIGSMPVVDAVTEMARVLGRQPDVLIQDTDGIGMAGFVKRQGECYR